MLCALISRLLLLFHYRTENFVKASQLLFRKKSKRKDCDEMNAWMDDMLNSEFHLNRVLIN